MIPVLKTFDPNIVSFRDLDIDLATFHTEKENSWG
jgi:hypothetical protein